MIYFSTSSSIHFFPWRFLIISLLCLAIPFCPLFFLILMPLSTTSWNACFQAFVAYGMLFLLQIQNMQILNIFIAILKPLLVKQTPSSFIISFWARVTGLDRNHPRPLATALPHRPQSSAPHPHRTQIIAGKQQARCWCFHSNVFQPFVSPPPFCPNFVAIDLEAHKTMVTNFRIWRRFAHNFMSSVVYCRFFLGAILSPIFCSYVNSILWLNHKKFEKTPYRRTISFLPSKKRSIIKWLPLARSHPLPAPIRNHRGMRIDLLHITFCPPLFRFIRLRKPRGCLRLSPVSNKSSNSDPAQQMHFIYDLKGTKRLPTKPSLVS